MALDPRLLPHQVLAVAIRSEVDAARFYTDLQAQVRNVILLQKLKFLAFEEEQHKKILERLLAQRYPGASPDAPEKSLLPPIAADLGPAPSVLDLFRAALKAEEVSEKFYGSAEDKAEDEGSRGILAYLGRVERSHQAVIRSEIELLAKFPDYYKVEEFHIGQDLFHLGP